MFYKLSYFFRMQYRRIKRFIAWFPVIWEDEDWDSEYLFRIMKFKISRMRIDMDRAKFHVGYEQDVLQMKRAEFLLNRLCDNRFYSDQTQIMKDDRCKCLPMTDENVWGKEHPSGVHEYIYRPCLYCQTTFKPHAKKQQADYEYTWDYIKKHAQGWWW